MDKQQILADRACGLVAVCAPNPATRRSASQTPASRGGVAAIEISYTVPGASAIIEQLAGRYRPEEIIIGAGTVMDSATGTPGNLSGARYGVSPALIGDGSMCRLQIAVLPGAMTIRNGRGHALRRRPDQALTGELFGPAMSRRCAARAPGAACRRRRHGRHCRRVEQGGAVGLLRQVSLTGRAKRGDYDAIHIRCQGLYPRDRSGPRQAAEAHPVRIRGLKDVDRALDLLELLAHEAQGLRPVEIGAGMGINKGA